MRRIISVLGGLITAGCASFQANLPATLTAEHAVASSGKAATFAIANAGSISPAAIEIVRSGLERRGMKYAPADAADVVVSLSYSISGPSTVREWASDPVYGTAYTPGYVTQRPVGTDKNGRTIYTTVTVAGTTTQRYVGENFYCAATTVYDKQLTLSARPTSRAPSDVPAWDVRIAVTDNVKDLSKYAATLARAAVNQAGGASQLATPVMLVDGGRKVKARKVDTTSATAAGAPGAGYRGRPGARCGNDTSNPAAAIRSAGCATSSVRTEYPVIIGGSPFATALAIASCAPGVVGRAGDSRWR